MNIDLYLNKLIAFKTLSLDHTENQKAFEWIKEELRELPLHFTDYSSNGFPSLIITTRKTKKPKVWLQGHMDVVPGPDEIFKTKLVGSKIYGRGTFDMKFAIAVYIQLFKDLGQTLPQYDIGMMLTSDEEIGGAHGVGALVKEGYGAEICLLPDGGENWVFQRGAKGIYQISIEAKGKAAHGARPWKGHNAIEELVRFLQIVKAQFPSEPCNSADHYHNTLNIGKIIGGTVTNQVPVHASASVDIRYIPETTEKDIESILLLAKKQCKNISISKLATGLSYKVDTTNEYFMVFADLIKKYTKKDISFLFSPGSSDGRYFINNNTPAILVRPVGANLHRDDEWIDKNSLETFYHVVKEFVEDIHTNP